jgi:hypothetical protein
MKRFENKKNRGIKLIPLFLCFCSLLYCQNHVGDSIVNYYSSHAYSFDFVETFYSSTDGKTITNGNFSGYKAKDVFYRLKLDSMKQSEGSWFMGMDCAKNSKTVGCNSELDKVFTNLKKNKDQYEQTVGIYLEQFIFDPVSFVKMFNNDKNIKVTLNSSNDHYLITIIDTNQVDAGMAITKRQKYIYKVSKKDFKVYSCMHCYDFSVDNVLFQDSIYTQYTYIQKTKAQILKDINSFVPYKEEEDHAVSLNEQDTITTFPNFNLADLPGNSIDSKTIKAKYTLAEFWYMGCLPCRKNLKKLDTLRTAFDPDFLEILGINDADEVNAVLKDFIDKFNPTYKILLNGKGLRNKLNPNYSFEMFK